MYESYYCGRCTNLYVFKRIDAVAGFELAVAVHQLEEVDVLRRLVFELRHGLIEDRLDGVEAVCIIVIVVFVLCAVGQARCR